MAGKPRPPWAANLLGLDYRMQAAHFAVSRQAITDIHLHINGTRAAAILREAADLYGIRRFLTQTRIEDAGAVRGVFGDRVHFVAGPQWMHEDRGFAFREGFLEQIAVWGERWGARVVKLWAAPRLWEILGSDATDIVPLDSEWRVRQAALATDLGMMIMTHIGDPDTWFRTKYADASIYRAKKDYYVALERMLDRFGVPWIAAHMGGYPEDLDFLSGLLSRHENLYLDTSATKWIIRELSHHPREKVREFFDRWRGRILFGSDIVTLDDHLAPTSAVEPAGKGGEQASSGVQQRTVSPMAELAATAEQAFELYASRYWALRTMFETDYRGPSPIADPDLAMVDPSRSVLDSPPLQGLALPGDVLESLYQGAAEAVVFRWIREHP